MTTWPLHTHDTMTNKDFRHGWSDASGPDFKVDPGSPDHAGVVAEIVKAAGLKDAAWARQVHGGKVLYVEGPGLAGDADALWTDVPGLGLVGRSADCPLILVGGRKKDGAPITGFAHASWRSTVKGITRELLSRMIVGGLDPESARAFICPSAGVCCYEVGQEVRQAMLDALGSEAGWFFLERSSQMTFDLWAANRAQLVERGVPEDSIHQAGVCTICGEGYPSHRRDGKTAGRFAAIIGHRAQSPAGA